MSELVSVSQRSTVETAYGLKQDSKIPVTSEHAPSCILPKACLYSLKT